MKKLHEIKDEYAGEQGRDSWDEFFEYCELTHTPLERMQYHHDEVAKRFAIEVAKEALNNAHESCLKGSNGGPEAALRSILKQTNIPKL
ncbi:hypothetical protein [Sphingobacterium sp.]|uniref:hypothetical protein n=1 Tax=Sphingobacterium sp. TaxID=341027 RepID=UPI00289A5FA7|nr:hypothetical protein [Sphingobacterium sp.]